MRIFISIATILCFSPQHNAWQISDPFSSLRSQLRVRRDEVCYPTVNDEVVHELMNKLKIFMTTSLGESGREDYIQLTQEPMTLKNSQINVEQTSCKEGIQILRNSFSQLIGEYYLLQLDKGKNSITTDDECLEKNADLQRRIEELQRNPDNGLRLKNENLEQENERLTKTVEDTYEELDNLKKDYKELYRKTIVDKIRAGQLDDAIVEMRKTKDIDEIEPIVEGAYAAGTNQSKIIDFIVKLPLLEQETKGYEKMYEIMDRRGDLQNGAMISLHYNALKALRKDSLPDVLAVTTPILEKLVKDTKEPVKEVVAQISQKLQEGSDIKSLAAFGYDRQDSYTYFIEEIIKGAYNADFSNVRNIMLFANELQKIEQSARIYIELYKELKDNSQLNLDIALELAQKIKELMDYANYKNVKMEAVKISLEDIKSQLPSGVNALIWDKVCIRSKSKGGNLFEESAYVDNRRRVILSRSKSGSYKWSFEARNEASFFRIRNVYSKQFFYVSTRVPHEVFTGMNQKPMTWGDFKLVDKDWQNNEFYLANTNSTGSVDAGFGLVKMGEKSLLADKDKTESAVWYIIPGSKC